MSHPTIFMVSTSQRIKWDELQRYSDLIAFHVMEIGYIPLSIESYSFDDVDEALSSAKLNYDFNSLENVTGFYGMFSGSDFQYLTLDSTSDDSYTDVFSAAYYNLDNILSHPLNRFISMGVLYTKDLEDVINFGVCSFRDCSFFTRAVENSGFVLAIQYA